MLSTGQYEWLLDCIKGWTSAVPSTSISEKRLLTLEDLVNIDRENTSTLCDQRFSEKSTREGGYLQIEGSADHRPDLIRTDDKRSEEVTLVVQEQIHRLVVHSHPHSCGFLYSPAATGTCYGSEVQQVYVKLVASVDTS